MAAIVNGKTALPDVKKTKTIFPDIQTPIQKFYAGKNVFITGATGFLGKLLLEKLLWSCPDIGNIYILARDKKGKDLTSRVDELCDSVVFSRVARDRPGYKKKILPVAGDLALPNLGISTEDCSALIQNVHVVFHCAATVRFQEPLLPAMVVNVKATQVMLEMAKKIPQLKAFIHVSTAFAHCHSTDLLESFYPTPVDPLSLLKLVETTDPAIVEVITPSIVGKWPNTYSFTKALAEDYVRQEAVGLPVGVYRPSIVMSSVKEPLSRWVDNMYGVSGYVAGCGLGLLKALYSSADGQANAVPADMTVNGLVAAAWDVAEKHKTPIQKATADDISIYNFVLADNPLLWRDLYRLASQYGESYPPSRAIWYRCLVINESRLAHSITRFLLHRVPAHIGDVVCRLAGSEPQFVRLLERIEKMEDVTQFFTRRVWNFSNKNIRELYSKMTPEDRKLYFFDVSKIRWAEYFKEYFLGIRRYLLKDDDSTIPAAKAKYFKLYLLHRFVQLGFVFLFSSATYQLLTYMQRRLRHHTSY